MFEVGHLRFPAVPFWGKVGNPVPGKMGGTFPFWSASRPGRPFFFLLSFGSEFCFTETFTLVRCRFWCRVYLVFRGLDRSFWFPRDVFCRSPYVFVTDGELRLFFYVAWIDLSLDLFGFPCLMYLAAVFFSFFV